MKLYFLFCQEFQQMVALFGGCGFGLFERVYLKLFCQNNRLGDTQTHRKIAKQFYLNDEQYSEICSDQLILHSYVNAKRGNKAHQHIYLMFSMALQKSKMERSSIKLFVVSCLWFLSCFFVVFGQSHAWSCSSWDFIVFKVSLTNSTC